MHIPEKYQVVKNAAQTPPSEIKETASAMKLNAQQ